MNNPPFADLHIHTHYSDSSSSPQEVINDALKAGLSCIAITDHDTIDVIVPVQEIATPELEIVPGIELSSEIQGKDIHILGYFFDIANGPLVERLTAIQLSRIERMKKMIMKLKDMGIKNIELEEVCALTRSRSVGRPHLAAVLKEKGWIGSLNEAFDRFIGEGGPAYYTKYDQSPYEAIKLIKNAGGLAVMAHPMLTQKDELIKSFVEAGLDGLEVYYPNCSDATIEFYFNLAQKHQLLMTGGSDAHGAAKVYTHVGKTKIPYELVEKMKEALKLKT